MENKKVFIGNLDFTTTKEEVKTLLSDYGTVVNIKMHKKKGYAFIEMSDEAEAALAIEKLKGMMFKDREIRISPEIKASKAKAQSIKNYNERADSFSRQKKISAHPQRKEWSHDRPPRQNRTPRDGHKTGHGGYPEQEINYNSRDLWAESTERPPRSSSRGRSDSPHPQRKEWSHDRPPRQNRTSRDGHKPGYGRSQQPETNYNTRERWSDSPHPQRKEWSHDRPPRQNRTSRDGHKPGYGRSQQPETNYNTRERWTDSTERPPRNYSRGRSDSPHPQRKEWSHDRPPRQNRTSRDGHKPGYGRSQQPETNYNTRERWSDSTERPPRNYSRGRSDSPHPQRKEWSHDKPAHPGRPSGGARTRNDSKPRPTGGSPNRFSASSRPKSGASGKGKSANSGKPKAGGGAGNRGSNTRAKRD